MTPKPDPRHTEEILEATVKVERTEARGNPTWHGEIQLRLRETELINAIERAIATFKKRFFL